jgi:hypothetical protein
MFDYSAVYNSLSYEIHDQTCFSKVRWRGTGEEFRLPKKCHGIDTRSNKIARYILLTICHMELYENASDRSVERVLKKAAEMN